MRLSKQIEPATLQVVVWLCMSLRLDANKLTEHVDELKCLTINAEILAAKVGVSGRVFQTLASETHRLSKQITTDIKIILDVAQQIARKIIFTSRQVKLYDQYRITSQRKLSSNNLEDVEKCGMKLNATIEEDLIWIESNLLKLTLLLDDLLNMHVFISMISNMLKIEENQTESLHGVVTPHANALNQLGFQLQAILQKARGKTVRALKTIEKKRTY